MSRPTAWHLFCVPFEVPVTPETAIPPAAQLEQRTATRVGRGRRVRQLRIFGYWGCQGVIRRRRGRLITTPQAKRCANQPAPFSFRACRHHALRLPDWL